MERTSANQAIDSMIIGSKSYSWKHEYIGNDDVPRCDIARKIIYSPKFGPIINEEDDALVRGKNIHECAHARLTPRNGEKSWGSVKMNIVNALEDCRIEKAVGEINNVIAGDIRALNVSMNRRINKSFSDAEKLKNVKPINEALTAMMFSSTGLPIGWNMSAEGQKYFDACKDIFEEYKDIEDYDKASGFDKVIKIADKIYEKMKEVKEEEKSEKGDDSEKSEEKSEKSEGDSEKSEGKSSSDEREESEKSDKSKSSSGSGGNDEDEGEESSSDSGNGEEGESESSDSSEKSEESSSSDDAKSKNGKGSKKTSENGEKNSEKGEDSEKSEGKSEKSEKGEVEKELEEDCEEGNEVEKALEKEIKDILKESKKESENYTSYTDEDIFVVPKKDVDNFESSRKSISSQIGKLSNYTEEALRAMSRCQKMKNLEKGRIDNRKLCGLSKSLTKKVFYKTKDGIDTNVDVCILIDESGSIGGMKYDLRTLTIAFSEVFNRLGINFEVMGYTTVDFGSRNRSFTRSCPIKMKVYKSFKENYGNARYRLGSIESENHNVDGESVLHAYKRILKEKGKRKIIFVLSDGIPEAGLCQYELGKHLKKVVGDIRKNHDEIYAFGIGTRRPEEFYGSEYFIYLDDIKELGPIFFKRFKEIVAK